MKRLFTSTPGGKSGAIDGLNLFFGALLGANLGTLGAMPLWDYVKPVVLLAGTVMTLRMVSTSERRVYMLLLLAIYGLLIAGVLFLPYLQPQGLPRADLYRLAATLVVWIVFVVASEVMPVSKPVDGG